MSETSKQTNTAATP